MTCNVNTQKLNKLYRDFGENISSSRKCKIKVEFDFLIKDYVQYSATMKSLKFTGSRL